MTPDNPTEGLSAAIAGLEFSLSNPNAGLTTVATVNVDELRLVLGALNAARATPQELSAEHRKRLLDLVDQWECAARLCDAVVQVHYHLVDEFAATPRDTSKTYDIRMIRSVQDEKSTRDRWIKDAEALKALLAARPQAEGGGS